MKAPVNLSPNLKLVPAVKAVAMVPTFSIESTCPFELDACGYNQDPPRRVFREYISSLEELVMWRYVVAGSLLWKKGDSSELIGPGTVLATHQPATTRLHISREGACVLWVLLKGRPSIDYFDQIVSRFGPIHTLAPGSTPVRLAEELVQHVRSRKAESPFFWSKRSFEWLSSYHEQLESNRVPLRKVLTQASPPADLLPEMPRTVKGFAAQLGYSPAHFSRELARKWKVAPGKLLRDYRIREAASQLMHTSDPVQVIARKIGYSSVPAFITAFKRIHGMTPLVFRHQRR